MRAWAAGYGLAYRLGFTPWESPGTTASSELGAPGPRGGRAVRQRRPRPRPGLRARPEDQRAGETRLGGAVGVDVVPAAIEAARRRAVPGATDLVADVTDLPAELGTFDFFLDVGCFQHLDAAQRSGAGCGITALADRGATLLMLEFGATPIRRFLGGVSRAEIEAALPGWEMVSAEPASTRGLGRPLTQTSPRWYRLRHGR